MSHQMTGVSRQRENLGRWAEPAHVMGPAVARRQQCHQVVGVGAARRRFKPRILFAEPTEDRSRASSLLQFA